MIRCDREAVKVQSPLKADSPKPVSATFDSPVRYLRGVGPRRSDLFRRLGISTLRDLVYHLPRRHEDRRTFLPIAQLAADQKATVRGRVTATSLFRAKTGTVILQVAVADATGKLMALWFNQPYMRRWFPIDSEIILYGTVDRVGSRIQMAVPEFELVPMEKGDSPSGTVPGSGAKAVRSLHMGRVVPIYPATSGLHQRELRTAAAWALKSILPGLKDPLPPGIRQRHALPDLATALKGIHFPPDPESVRPAQERLTFDELFYFQLALGLRRRRLQARPGIAHAVEGDRVERWRRALPFVLTGGQQRAMEEIAADMASPKPMHRLLQGEVGSGKTVVAAFAAVVAVQGGFQAVILAPTEVLARQHALTLSQLLAPVDVPVGLLTSSVEEPARRALAEELARGTLPVLVGTHAVLEPWVKFARLGLVVIDEQQKFGVDQRGAIAAKGDHPDLLVLTATPIPRTLALTLYGEMEISTIQEKPVGREPVRTLWVDSTRREEIFTFVRSELDAGRQAYVVCPRIGDSAGRRLKRDLFAEEAGASQSALKIFEEYRKIFSGHSVGLLHGRMRAEEQRKVFAAFKRKEIQVLVATQVIEVGVDVPNATVMVVEGAQRFGLAQLHQLRGRVGRGEHWGTCILVADPNPTSAERLQRMVETADGFQIAEEDLRLRGPGELLGKRQAGLPDLICLQWAAQGPWLEVTRKEAEELLAQDPDCSGPAWDPLRKELLVRFPSLIGREDNGR